MPADWLSLCVLVFLLGIKHGFDADHLATIDGLTRLNHRAGKRFARYCGSLFSLGHGAVVMLIAAAVGVLSTKWHTPAWLDTLGVSISVAFLFALGIANLRAVLAAEPGRVVAPVGLKGRFLGSLLRASHPAAVAGVGALFALSFDTVSQSALFALTAARFGGIGHALFLGALFVLGMLVTDGINGLWISRLIARADAAAVLASRVMGIAVATVSLLVGALSLAKVMSPMVAQWTSGKEVVFGAVVVAALASSYVVARAIACRARFAVVTDEAAGARPRRHG
jgi:nickel/cobalt transporter (NiCoT) family protein